MDSKIDLMIKNAVNALKNAYAPYSHFCVGACICSSSGNLYTGVNIENSSYGLTLCAESSAIAQMISAGEKIIDSIVILASSNQLCSPCGACRQRIFEFSTSQTQVLLCNHQHILERKSIDELLPLGFKLS